MFGVDAASQSGMLTLGSFIFPATLIASSLIVDYLLTFQVRLTGERVLLAKLCLESVTLTGVVIGVLLAWGVVTIADGEKIAMAEEEQGRTYWAAGQRPTGAGNRLVFTTRAK